LEGIGEGFFALDPDWRFTIFNTAAETIFGLARADVLGKQLWEVSPRIVGTEFERRYRKVMSERVRQEFESFSSLRPDAYHEIRAFPLGGGIGVAFRDISHRQRTTEALRERERELARFQRIGGMGGMEIDLRAGFQNRRSPEYLLLHGLPPESRNEGHEAWVRRIHPEDRVATETAFLDTLKTGSLAYRAEYRIVRPSDGAVRWLNAVAEIERDEEGRAVKMVGAHIDVTERKLAEQAAKESEERLRATTDALPLLISYIDRDEYFRFANKPYEAWFSKPLSEIIGRKVHEIMDPESYEARRPFIARALAGETVTYEAEYPRPEGMAITEITHSPRRDASGRVVGIYALVQDITARKRSERALAESEQRFRSIADSAPVPMWVSRLNGLREFVNQAYVDFLKLPIEAALNFDWRKALHPEDLQRILEEQRVGEGSRRFFALEARYRGGDGAWHWLRSESQPRWGPQNEHIGFIGVAHDITISKQAEQSLLELNEVLERRIAERTQQLASTRALIESFFLHSSECHSVLAETENGGFRFEEANPATLRLYNKTREQVIGFTLDEVLGAEAGALVARALTTSLLTEAPARYERMQGSLIVEAVATPVPREPDAPRRVIVSARDVTQHRRLEQQLRQAQKMEAVGQLTGGVAHDFNNLLTLVVGGLDTIGRLLPNLPAPAAQERVERAREMALQGAKRAATLTSRLLAFSRQQTLTPRALDANALVAGACELLRRTLGESITVESVLPPGIWPIRADPNQLENALLNLALNARDAMPGGGKLTIETANAALDAAYVAALPEIVAPGPYVMIAVADNGEGMDAATRERAFDPFFTTKDVGKGTGLGLSQVHGFARQSAGFVRIQSERGEGATIRIYLPRHVGPDPAAPEGPVAAAAATPARDARLILVVEDDQDLRNHTCEILRELGYRVLEADRGETAIRVLDDRPDIDLLLSDVVMPGGVDGGALADIARRRKPGLKVLFMTGYARNAVLQHDRLAAGAHMIAKPFSFEQIAAKVRERLEAAD
jgi:PAS domain S-box-containing protein